MARRVFQNNCTSGVITPAAYSRVDIARYLSALKQLLNGFPLVHGGVCNRPGTYFVDLLPGRGFFVRFKYSVVQNYALCFMDRKMRVYMNGGVVANPETGATVEIATPYSLSDMDARRFVFAQSADVMFIAHPKYPPYRLTRRDHHIWEFNPIEFEPSLEVPATPTVTARGFTLTDGDGAPVETPKSLRYKVSALSEDFEESYPSEPGEVMIPKIWTANATVEVTWTAVPGAAKYNIYKNSRGYYGWIGYVDAGDELKFVDDNIAEDVKDGPKNEKNPFEQGNNPGVTAIYRQRLYFARTNKQPQTIFASQPGAFNNFSISYPLKADDSIESTMDSNEMNEIRYLIPVKSLLVLTEGSEYLMTAGSNGAVSPLPGGHGYVWQSDWGTANVPPLKAGNNILIVQNSGRIVRDLFYFLGDEGYVGEDISILAEHLLYSPIVEWDYQNEPYHLVYCIRKDGRMITLTYMREQQIRAWAYHETDGNFISVCCIRNARRDDVYFIVERGGKYMVEYQKIREYGDPIEEAFFVDCGVTYRGEPTKRVTGLEHLAGKTVSVLSDGSPIMGSVVNADGSLELPEPARIVHAGLPYTSLLETLDPELNNQEGTQSGQKKVIPTVTVRIRETLGLRLGASESSATELKYNHPSHYNKPYSLFSGDFDHAILGENRTEATVVIKQELPLPMTVLSVVTTIT